MYAGIVAELTYRMTAEAFQNVCIIPTYAPVCDSPAIGLVGKDESRGVANTENVPVLLLFT